MTLLPIPVLCLVASGDPVETVAPPFPAERWVPAAGVEAADGPALADLRGRVVLLVAFPPDASDDALALVELLARANEDRDLTTVGLVRGADDGTAAAVEARELAFPVAAAEGGPYRDAAEGGARASVVGRTGELLFAGDPLDERDELLAAVRAGLLRFGGPPLAADLPEALAAAQADWFLGRWSDAREEAEKVRRRAEGRDDAVAAAARDLVALADGWERDLDVRLAAEADGYPREDFVRMTDAIAFGFPRTDLARRAEEVLERKRAEMGHAMHLRLARRWLDELPDRPTLFPAVRDRRGDRYARELEKLLRSDSISSDLTRRAEALLASYQSAVELR